AVGFGLLQALQIIERYASRRIKRDIRTMIDQLEQGDSFSTCLIKIRFPPFYRFLMQAAEHHGRFTESLGILSVYYEQRSVRKGQYKKALFYPTLVLLTCIGSFVFIIHGLLPQLAQLYD